MKEKKKSKRIKKEKIKKKEVYSGERKIENEMLVKQRNQLYEEEIK